MVQVQSTDIYTGIHTLRIGFENTVVSVYYSTGTSVVNESLYEYSIFIYSYVSKYHYKKNYITFIERCMKMKRTFVNKSIGLK